MPAASYERSGGNTHTSETDTTDAGRKPSRAERRRRNRERQREQNAVLVPGENIARTCLICKCSTENKTIPELVDETCGWLSPFGDIPALVAHLNAMLDAPTDKLTEMAVEGRRRVLAFHHQDQNAAQLRLKFEEGSREYS